MDEKHLEQAAALTDHLRDDALADIHRSVQGNGQDECEDCGESIPAARRQAAPFAIRCTLCQSRHELLGNITNRSIWSHA